MLLRVLFGAPSHVAAYMYYYDNPKGNIPTWLINWACKVSASTVGGGAPGGEGHGKGNCVFRCIELMCLNECMCFHLYMYMGMYMGVYMGMYTGVYMGMCMGVYMGMCMGVCVSFAVDHCFFKLMKCVSGLCVCAT